eukprot:TRINITY_DN3285_c0_g1_i1.p3 TRINITY_DN3285_c0_g1~~TRINITY_DN3285_c0_g1_i1.p3  ORF type:complete len:50 (-),score=7.18 TRINITY_DN3285_c0_g1_i1:109-258(-)
MLQGKSSEDGREKAGNIKHSCSDGSSAHPICSSNCDASFVIYAAFRGHG